MFSLPAVTLPSFLQRGSMPAATAAPVLAVQATPEAAVTEYFPAPQAASIEPAAELLEQPLQATPYVGSVEDHAIESQSSLPSTRGRVGIAATVAATAIVQARNKIQALFKKDNPSGVMPEMTDDVARLCHDLINAHDDITFKECVAVATHSIEGLVNKPRE
jgi:hypothetical protein